VKTIEIDPKLCITHKTDDAKVQKYKALMLKGVIFPAIDSLFKDGRYYVKDGAHRTKACLELNETVLANVFDEEEFPDKHLLGSRLTWNKTAG
jgi:hypothetical protein